MSVKSKLPGAPPLSAAAQMGRPSDEVVTINKPESGWRLVNLRELWRYRDLFYFLVWRDIKARYAQSVLGAGWAVIQPFMSMIVFTIIFGTLAEIDSDGVPYAVFSYTALVPWAYFSRSLSTASSSIGGSVGIMGKVYFPRMVVPLSAVLGKLVDFVIAFVIIFGLMAWFKIFPTVWIFALPLLVLIAALTAAGFGMWLGAMSVHYRDVNYAMSFFVQLYMYASPVVYPTSLIPPKYQLIYAINPLVGVVEGFRSALLRTNPMPWDLIGVGSAVAVVVAVSGAFIFRRLERSFVDVA